MPTTSAPALPFDALDQPPEVIEQRFARAVGYSWMWPHMPPAAWRTALRAIEAAVRARLAGAEARLETPAGASVTGVAAFTSGTGPLLGHWLEAGTLRADPECEALLRLHLEHGRVRAERLEAALRGASTVLNAAGVASVLVKGMHTARTLFPEPGTRPMSDIDLVLPLDHFARAERALAEAGYTQLRGTRTESPPHADWVPHGAPTRFPSLELAHADAPFSINLRGGYTFPLFGGERIDLGAPGPGDRVALPGGGQALDAAWHLAYLAVHASLHRNNLTMIRVVELALAARAGADWDRLTRLLHERSATAFVYPAVALAEALSPGAFPPEVMRELAARALPRHRRAFTGLGAAEVQPSGGTTLGDYFFWARGPVHRLRLLLTVVVPRTPRVRWRSVLRRLRPESIAAPALDGAD